MRAHRVEPVSIDDVPILAPTLHSSEVDDFALRCRSTAARQRTAVRPLPSPR